jgi:hypothetical protein
MDASFSSTGPPSSVEVSDDQGFAVHQEQGRSPLSSHRTQGIGRMENMQTLSCVEVSDEQGLTKVGRLHYLRKLGVVIHGNQALLNILVRVIGMLNEILCSILCSF